MALCILELLLSSKYFLMLLKNYETFFMFFKQRLNNRPLADEEMAIYHY